MKHSIRLTNVTKRYGKQTALDDVTIEVPKGTVYALLGENGAGKTTTIRILLGLADPDTGEAEVMGMSSHTHSTEIRRRVGYVPERPTLYEWMTVNEIGWFTAGFYGPDFLPRYMQYISRFALPPGRKIDALSKGMRAKVALSLAMAHRPEVLVLDEPTSGLDTLVRREFLESMVDMAAGGQTVLLSSHQIGEVERVADHVAILKKGKLVVAEKLDDLKDQILELIVTLHEATSVPPAIGGQVLAERRRPRQWQALVRGLSENEIESLRGHAKVVSVETRRPSLEEIFVAYMHDAPPNESSGEPASSETVNQ